MPATPPSPAPSIVSGSRGSSKAALPPDEAGFGIWSAKVWRLAVPIILANLSTPMLGAVDTAVMGHLPEPAYIGAVAISALVFNFLYWGFGFLRMGTTGFAAQAYGADDRLELAASFGRALLLALLLGASLIALQVPIEIFAFWLVDSSETVEGLARDYYAIRIWSAPATLINYAVLGWLLGTQRTLLALAIQVTLNAINITLDLIFVVGFGWGIEGVAYASIIAEATAAGLGLAVVLRLLRREGGRLNWPRILDRARLLAVVKVNRDIFLRTLSLITAFATFTIQGAKLGELPLAANAILLQLQGFVFYGLDGFAHAAEILAGGAKGARQRRAFRRVVLATGLWALILALGMSLVLALAGPSLVRLFTSIPEVRAETLVFLPWMIASPLISVWSYQLDGIFIGATRTAAMRNAMAVSLAGYLLAVWLLVPSLGNHGLWASLMIFMTLRAVTLVIAYPALERSIRD